MITNTPTPAAETGTRLGRQQRGPLRDRTLRPGWPAGDDGMVTAFVVIMMFALLLLTGLVLDGGLTLAARVQAINEAQAAARAGAQQVNLTAYRDTGQETLDPTAATGAARAYLTAAGHAGTITVAGDQVTVTVRIAQPTQILGIAGIHTLTVTGTGSARAEQTTPGTAP